MLNILIPAAGAGKRFQEAGYKEPKPFININGKPMIQRVVESLRFDGQYIFILQKEHLEQYDGYALLNKIAPKCVIIPIEGLTEGAVSTCLLAEKYINNDNPLVIANSDQIVKFNSFDFLMNTNYYDGCILTFPVKDDPKWSYVETQGNRVTKVVEKIPISDKGNVGVYSWCRGEDFVKSAKSMIEQNIRTNGEFYIAPTYNELIATGHWITWQNTLDFMPCGTPRDLYRTIALIHHKELIEAHHVKGVLNDITAEWNQETKMWDALKVKYVHVYSD